MNTMQFRSLTLLLAASLVVISNASTGPMDAMVKAFAKTHSANGSAVGTLSWSGNTTNSEKKLGGLDAYVAVPKQPFKSAVLVVTDIYGYKTDNVRKWADQLAADEGFLAVVPDYFKGNPRKTTDSPDTFAAWRALYPREQVLKETAAVLGDIRKQYPTVKKIGAEGFCWGGLYAVLLTTGKTPAVSAAVVYHGSLITKEDVEAIKAPILFQQSDPAIDKNLNTTVYKEFKSIIDAKKAKGLDASIEFYAKQPHGFSLRRTEPSAAVAATSAFNKGATFLKKYLTN